MERMYKPNKDGTIGILSKKWPTAEDLRKAHPDISHLLEGEFVTDKFNVYEFPSGLVVSRPLDQGLIINPTVGLVLPGSYEFNTGNNTETMTVIEGKFRSARINEGPEVVLQKYESITAPSGTKLKLSTITLVFYLCQYKPKE